MPQFTYSSTPNPAENSYFMDQENAAPALAVWLFLVTQPNFLSSLDGVQDPAGDFNVTFTDAKNHSMDIPGIATMTNLTQDTVRTIVRQAYLTPNLAPADQAANKAAFGTVASQFQGYVGGVVNVADGWDDGECPGIVGISTLAKSGALVDPATAPVAV